MDDLDNKSLRQLAGLKKIITECGEPMGPTSGAKIPASLNLTADSGPELSGMLRDIMSLAGLHKVEPEHMPPVDSNMLDATVTTQPTMASLIGRMDDIADPEGEVKEVDEVPGYANSPEEAYSGENFPMGTGDINNDTTAAKDALVSKANESMPEELMHEYRKFASETNNPVSPNQSDPAFQQMNDVYNQASPETKKAMMNDPKIKAYLKGVFNPTLPGQQPLADDLDAEKAINPQPKAGIEVVQQTGGGTKSDEAGKWTQDGKRVEIVAQPKGTVAGGAQQKVAVPLPMSSGKERVEVGSNSTAKTGVDPSQSASGRKIQIDPKGDRTNEGSRDEDEYDDYYSTQNDSALRDALRNQDNQDSDSRRSSAAISRQLAKRGLTQESIQLQRIISQLSAKYDVDSKILEAALPSIVSRLTEAKKKPSAGMTKKEKSEVVKKAKKGEDIGKPGKNFKKVETAAKKSGAKDPKAVAAAAMWKNEAKKK